MLLCQMQILEKHFVHINLILTQPENTNIAIEVNFVATKVLCEDRRSISNAKRLSYQAAENYNADDRVHRCAYTRIRRRTASEERLNGISMQDTSRFIPWFQASPPFCPASIRFYA